MGFSIGPTNRDHVPPFRLNRRTLLRGAGSVAIALPWLEIMEPPRPARAAPLPARRFLAVFTPGGTVLDQWRPTGTENAFTLSPILAPLEPVRASLVVLDGLAMKSAIGDQSAAGIIAWLTGTTQVVNGSTFAQGPSIDQVLAGNVSSVKKKASLQMAVRWGTGRCHGVVAPYDVTSFENSATFRPIAPALDPVQIFQDLFGSPGDLGGVAWDKSILDAVSGRYVALAPRLGANDRRKVEEHLTKIREMEMRLAGGARCRPPMLVDTSDYDPRAGLKSSDTGDVRDLATDAAIPKVGKLMTDMMVMALACDITAVGTLQWSDTEAKYTMPWLNLPETQAYYENDGGYHPVELTKLYTWYSQQHAYLLDQMSKVDMGGHSLLDESVVFFGTELQNPATHQKTSMPFLLAGKGGGLRGGRYVQYSDRSHNDLLVAIFNLFGDTRTTFGDPKYCTGPLPGLT
jgi:hypothetical protein